MKREFVRLPEFERCWAKLNLTEDDIVDLEEFLCITPQSGKVIPGTGGLRKLRWFLPYRGKRSGVRVLYLDFAFYERIYLISAYPKNVKDDLTMAERKEIKKIVQLLENEMIRK